MTGQANTPDVIVLGVGRSGTTTVARVLYERFGVCFGHHHMMRKEFMGEPVFEDHDLKRDLAALRAFGNGRISSWRMWLRYFSKNHEGCGAKYKGVKLLDLVYLPVEAFEHMAPKLIVRTYRPMESCVDSWCRYNRRPRATNTAWYVEREFLLSELERKLPMVRIEFEPESRVLTDDEIGGLVCLT